MSKFGGWRGKTLRVDLSTGKISAEDTIEKYVNFLGGTGLAYKVLWDEVPPGTKPWDPENRLIFGIGPLTGTGAIMSSRVSITSFSPVNYMELHSDGHMGGHWGAELKFAGWDSIIIQGKADRPVWLSIEDDKVQIRDARHLWGNGIFRTTVEICDEMGPGAHVAAIGQAGENLVRMSTIMCDRSHSGGGHGSVMGAKNLKAIGVRGSGSIKIMEDPKKWKELVQYSLHLLGANSGAMVPATPQPWAEYYGRSRWNTRKGFYWGSASPPVETGICSADDLNRIGYRTHKAAFDHGDELGQRHCVRSGGCYGCPIKCHPLMEVPDLEQYGVSRFQSNTCVGNGFGMRFFENPQRGSKEALVLSQLGSAIADDYGIWAGYGLLLNDFMYAYKNDILKKYVPSKEYESVKWDLMKKKDPRFLFDIMKRFAYREGEIGAFLADGAPMLEDKYPEFKDLHRHGPSLGCFKLGHRWHHGSNQLGQVGALINMFYNRDPMCHSASNFEGSGLPLHVKKQVGEKLFGTPDAVDGSNDFTPMNHGKAIFARMALVYQALHDSLTLCNYTLPWWCSPHKSRGYYGDPEMETKLYRAITGDHINHQEMMDTGLRILTLHRAITARSMNTKNLRRDHDIMNDWMFDNPRDAVPFTRGHSKMDRKDMELARDLFYQEMGYDKTTGMPTRVGLTRLKLADVADDLEKRNLIV